jgi:O-antigen/teichoic acid export membrane protein
VTTTSEAARRTTGASVLGSSVWNAASSLVPQVYLVVTSIVLARFLGPDDMGRQSFISFVEISAVLVLTGGLPTALTRFVGEELGRGRPAAAWDVLRWAWRIQVVAAVVGTAGIAAVGLAGAHPPAAWVIAGGICGLAILHTVPSAALAGFQRWRGQSP